jgi:hypothetical protein
MTHIDWLHHNKTHFSILLLFRWEMERTPLFGNVNVFKVLLQKTWPLGSLGDKI